MLPNEIKDAIAKANSIVSELHSQDQENELRKELSSLTKKQLIERIVQNSSIKKPTVEKTVYAILAEPECAWLTWDMVALIVKNHIPTAETSAKSIRWYSSKAREKGQEVVPRVRAAQLAELLANLV